jgi:hypothetical protein
MRRENEKFFNRHIARCRETTSYGKRELRIAQSRQKSYADLRRRELSFEVGNYVYLKVSHMRALRCFKVRGKLAPRFIGPFKIMEKGGEVVYQLELPPQLSDVHNVFHVSQLNKCLHMPEERLPMEDLNASENLSYQEHAVKNLETSGRVTRNKITKMCKVQLTHYIEAKATWEREEDLRATFFKFLFPILLDLAGKIPFMGVVLSHPKISNFGM